MVSKGQTNAAIAQLRLKVLDELIANPNVTNMEIAKRLGINNHTVAKYKAEWELKFTTIRKQVEDKILQETEEKATLWQKVTQILGL